MDRWLGDGGMPVIGVVGGAFTGYGVTGRTWAGSPDLHPLTTWPATPTGDQAGIHSLLLGCLP